MVYVVMAVIVDLKFKVLIGGIAESELVKVIAWQGVGRPESTRNVSINQIQKYSFSTALQREQWRPC